MSEPFDPYRKWLGIPPQHQPPHHYRLLGIEAFESDADVIANAADGRMAQVKTFQTGRNSEASQRILNELATAKVCLLNPEKKADYDRRLREAIRAEQAAQGPPPATAARVPEIPSAGPPPLADALEQIVGPAAPPLAPDAGVFGDYESPSLAGSNLAAGGSPAKKRIVKKRRSQNLQIPVVVTGILLFLVLAVVMMAWNKKEAEDEQQKKEAERAEKVQLREDRVIQHHSPTPASPSHVERPPKDWHAPPASVVTTPRRPRIAVAPEGTRPEIESMIQTPGGNTGRRSPSANEPAEETETGLGPSLKQKKLPVPAEDAQKMAEAKIKDIYKKEFAAAKSTEGRLDLATKLCEAGVGMSDDPTARFVLWRLALHEAAAAGSLAKATFVIDKIDELYAADANALKTDAVNAAAEGLRPGAGTVSLARDVGEMAITLAEAAAADERFDVANRLAKLANRAALRVNDYQFKREMQDRNKEIERLKQKFAVVAEAMKKVAANPSDADANLAVGRWTCFVEGKWKKGLPLLAKGKDAALSAVAKQDLADPKDPKAQMDLGDAWWTLSEKEPSPGKAALQARAVRWYNEALPELTGLDKAKVERRVESLAATGGRVGK